MRKRLLPHVYPCATCGHKYQSRSEANECEERGGAPHRYHKFQVVEFVNKNGNFSAVVERAGGEDEKWNPHTGPMQYALKIDFSHFYKKKCRHSFAVGSFYQERLTQSFHRKFCCPLCSSRNVSLMHAAYTCVVSSVLSIRLEDIAHTFCRECDTWYFTHSQLEAMLKKAAETEASNSNAFA